MYKSTSIMYNTSYEESKNGGIVDDNVKETSSPIDGVSGENATAVAQKDGNQHDEKDMDRMGKLQQLRVRLPPVPASLNIGTCD